MYIGLLEVQGCEELPTRKAGPDIAVGHVQRLAALQGRWGRRATICIPHLRCSGATKMGGRLQTFDAHDQQLGSDPCSVKV